ncbi:MAG TPA: VWA domain-containing protein, partial [Terriglobales bacterium]|nr:VWA domain-containing protein [Terriglobales bacterium]
MPKLPVFPALAALLILLTGCGDLLAQAQPSQESDRDQSLETLKVNVDVVQLFFNVKDKRGALIPSLNKDDFQ